MSPFTVQTIEPLTLEAKPPLSEGYTLSPFVWQDGARWELLLRAVPRRDDKPALKISSVYYGVSEDGLHFVMDDAPALAAGPDPEDRDGCEDPTAAIWNGACYVYYTGWNQNKEQGNLLLASGPDPRHLKKQGVRLASTSEISNPKEATVVAVRDGTWRLFFEYAEGGASKIGIASGPSVAGPWTVNAPLFESRKDQWDPWHLSVGPILTSDPNRPVMFYNGATQDAHWRIGWIAFDANYTRIVDRCDAPLIVPPVPKGDYTDIAFASSAVETDDAIFLYYSVADRDLVRAVLHRS
jgi:predicted GH43/DUF377 family glycosyl hydrolase